MSDTEETISQEALETAADWCDRLNGLSAFERRQLKAWLGASEENARAFTRMRRAMLDVALLDAAIAVEDMDKSTAGPLTSLAAWLRPRFAGQGVWLAAAGALAVAGLILWLAPGKRPAPVQTVQSEILATAVGVRADKTLSDKSVVHLDADTRIAVRYSRAARDLSLERGEAIFEVTHDPARPFRVAAQTATVTAVGTVFDVDIVDKAVEVRVFKGTVRVADAGMVERSVTRGQWLILDPVRGISSGSFSPDTYQSWQSDWLQADDMPLDYAVAELNRYSRDKIAIEDPDIANVKLSGRFRLSNTDATLAQIAAVLQVHVVKHRGEIVLTPKRD